MCRAGNFFISFHLAADDHPKAAFRTFLSRKLDNTCSTWSGLCLSSLLGALIIGPFLETGCALGIQIELSMAELAQLRH